MAVILHPLYSPNLAPCDFFLFPKMKLKLKGCWFDTTEEKQTESRRVLDTVIESVPKMEEMVGPVSTCGRELLRGWLWPIGLMVSFTIFTASVWKILDTTLYMVITDTWHMQTNVTACVTKKLFLHLWIFQCWRVSCYLPPVVKNYHTNISYWNFSGTKYRRGGNATGKTTPSTCQPNTFDLQDSKHCPLGLGGERERERESEVQCHICPTKTKKQEHVQMSTQCGVCVSMCFKLHHTNLHLWRLSGTVLEKVELANIHNNTTVIIEWQCAEIKRLTG